MGDRPLVADGGEPGRHPARLQRGHPGVPLGREGRQAADGPAPRRRTAPRSSGATAPARACSSTAARAAATCCPGRPTRPSSPSAGRTRRRARTPAIGRSSRTGSTSRARSSCSCGRSRSRCIAAARSARRDVRPRGHRGGIYPLMRGAMCVLVRDLNVYSVLTDMMRGCPAVYATFASYDEVAHHSGLQRADTMEALRKLDQQFGRIARARRYAPRPYEIVVLSDHGQTQGATFKQRNGYGLDELVERSLARRARDRRRRRRRAGDGRADRAQRGDRPQAEEAGQERRLRARRRRARLGQPRPRLPDGGRPAAHARGDRGTPPGAAPGAAGASARRVAARALRTGRRRRARGGRRAQARDERGRPAATRSRTSRPRPRATSSARTASATWRTSWSAASTTPRSTRGAPSRS